MGNDAMLYDLYLREQEQKKKKSRHIEGKAWVEDADVEKAVAKIRDELGPLGFGCKVDKRAADAGAGGLARLDIWCDATPDFIEALVREGFAAVIEHKFEPTGPDQPDYLGSRVEVTYMAEPVAA